MQSVYSVFGTKLHLVLEDSFAEAYNRAAQAFLDSQEKHRERTGKEWTPVDSIEMFWTEEEQAAWNKFAAFINGYIEFVGGSVDLGYNEEPYPSDRLIKLEDQS